MHKVLIANRGEIAVRIISACAAAGFSSVAVFADGDAQALHTVLADEAYGLDGISPADTYLDSAKILEIARKSGATHVHPGYGFLSENSEFARAVIEAGLTWIGPAPETIEALGDKVKAREIAVAAHAPLAPGTDGPVPSAEEVRIFAEEHGLPVVIKAAHGGGGRGMRVLRSLDEAETAFASAQREAIGAFGNGDCFVERFLDKPRHVETQVAADSHGNILVLGTRDCSLQRRHQKLIEEAPAPFLTAEQLEQLESASKAIFAEANYVGVGTCEFLISQDGLISFLEVNTRIQVEHPVTEETTGIDLVRLQLDIADGNTLSFTEMPEPTGHAIEFRINAEDPALGFLPSAGEITGLNVPIGANVRWDSGVRVGTVLDGSFDSMLAKLIVTGKDRKEAIRNARFALKQLEITGLATVVPFARMMLERPEFTAENGELGIFTTWIEDELQEDAAPSDQFKQGLLPVGAKSYPGTGVTRFNLEINGKLSSVGLPDAVFAKLGTPSFAEANEGKESSREVCAPMGGVLMKYTVETGQTVEVGEQVALLEAMKTEVPVYAEVAGTVDQLKLEAGKRIEAGDVLLTFEA